MTTTQKSSMRIEVYQRFGDASSRARSLKLEHRITATVCRTVAGFAVVLPAPSASQHASSADSTGFDVEVAEETQRRYRSAHGERTTIRAESPRRAPETIHGGETSPPPQPWSPVRAQILLKELEHAFRSAPPQFVSDWAYASAGRFGVALIRRLEGGKELLLDGLNGVGSEINQAARAMMDARLVDHLWNRYEALRDSSNRVADSTKVQAKRFAGALKEDPIGVGSRIVVSALAFHYLGGGLDADGGVPDLDIELFGIEGHRSIFTHSILAGAVVETGLYSLYDFINRGHGYLPHPHDVLWDHVRAGLNEWLHSARNGASLGLAYHFAIDSTLQSGYYHDLPFSASSEIHQSILGANAVGEASAARGADAAESHSSDAVKVRDSANIMTGLAAVAGAIAASVFDVV